MTRPRQPRLAIVSTMTGASWGGSEELWAATARAARLAGWEVLVSVADPSSTQHTSLRESGIDVRKHFLPAPWSARVQQVALRAASALRSVTAFEPDRLLISQGSAYDLASNEPLYAALSAKLFKRIPTVILCQLNHDHPPPERLRSRARAIFSRAAAVLFVSEANLTQARRHLATDLPHARVVRNPVNLRHLAEVPPRALGQECRLASVARLDTAHKGQDVLLEALAESQWRDRDWRLSLYGTGPDEVYLRQLSQHFGLHERILFKGYAMDIRQVWAAEEILVLPSRAEGTPLSMVEAMVCGRPVIATRAACNGEWVTDGQSGFLAPASTTDSLSETLERAWIARSDWRAMGRVARKSAMTLMDSRPGERVLGILSKASVIDVATLPDPVHPELKW